MNGVADQLTLYEIWTDSEYVPQKQKYANNQANSELSACILYLYQFTHKTKSSLSRSSTISPKTEVKNVRYIYSKYTKNEVQNL